MKRQFASFLRLAPILVCGFVLASIVLFPPHQASADKLRVGHCYIGGAILPLWMPREEGFFKRQGLDVELVWIQGGLAFASLIAGDVDLVYCVPHLGISAIAGGADLVFLGSVYNRMQLRIVAEPGIEKLEQLKGKLIAIGRLNDVPYFYLRLALQSFGVNPEQDIKFVFVPGQNERVLALKNGRAAATILNPANAMMLEKVGFKTVLDLATLGFPVVGSTLTVRQRTVSEGRPILVKFLKALVQGIEKVQGDPETSKKILVKYLRLQDKDIVDENYRFNSGKNLEKIPWIPLQGMRYAIDFLSPTVPAVKKLKPESLIDHSLLEEALKEAK